MEKAELIKQLQISIKAEESVIPLYLRHMNDMLFLSGLEEGERETIAGTLNEMREDSLVHREIFETLLEEIIKAEKDVY